MNFRQSLTENIGVKLIALVVAVFIWFNASGQQQTARLRDVPLVIENLADTLTLTGTVPARVEVRIAGTRRQLLTLGFKRVTAAVDMAGRAPGSHRVTVSAASVRLPPGYDRRNVTVIAPTSLDLFVERVVSKRVQVALSTTGQLSNKLVMLGDAITVEPSWITVRGPASTVERIKSIPTATIDLARVRESVDRTIALDFDPGLLTCDPADVTIHIKVSERGERVLANVPPTVLVDSADYEAVVLPNAVSLTLEGPTELLAQLSSGDVSVLLNLDGRAPAQYTLAPDVILPEGITLAAMSVDSLVVRVSRRNADAQ